MITFDTVSKIRILLKSMEKWDFGVYIKMNMLVIVNLFYLEKIYS